jgi:hypothetical protein
MTRYRHRRSAQPTTPFTNPLEPGEIAVNTANRQIAIGDAASGSVGQPLPAIAVRYFDSRASYAKDDFVVNGGIILRAKAAVPPGAFDPTKWDQTGGGTDPQYVLIAGSTMTGMLLLPATAPSTGNHATNKTYVDAGDSALNTAKVAKAGDTMSGPLVLPAAAPTLPQHAGHKGYIDAGDTALGGLITALTTDKVAKAGDTMTGMLTLPATAPSTGNHATNKTYVDGAIAAKPAMIISDTPPVGVPDGTQWFESDTGQTFVLYFDGNSRAWVQLPLAVPAGMVRYDVAQGLNAQQKYQARANIDVPIVKKNYIINGAMQISQENGVTPVTASGSYPTDNFVVTYTGGVMTSAQVASQTPQGSPNRLRFTVTSGLGSVAVGDFCFIRHAIEGLRAADLMIGIASAKTVTLQFGIKAPAGTYSVAFQNAATNRSYTATYTITAGEANIDVVKSVTIPLDTTGTWAKDNTVGLYIYWTTYCGTTYQTPPGTWTAGIFFCATGASVNNTNGSVFELFDVSLTEGSVAPPFQVPDYASELAACQRYYYTLRNTLGKVGFLGYGVAGAACGGPINFPVAMRANPTVAIVGTWTSTNCGNAAVAGSCEYSITIYASLTGSGGMQLYSVPGTGYFTANARL